MKVLSGHPRSRAAALAIALGATFLCGEVVHAADGTGAEVATRPSTQSTTVPASRPSPTTEPASLATPRDALKGLARALRDGDAVDLQRIAVVESPLETRALQGIAEMAGALRVLHQRATERFGPEAAAQFTEDSSGAFDQVLARIDAAAVQVDGDVATVRYAQTPDQAYQLRRVGQEWKIPASQFCQSAPAEVMEQRLAEQATQIQIVNELASEIQAGKFKSADAASLAWRSKMMGAVSGGSPASSQPAGVSGPTTLPTQPAPTTAKVIP